MSKGYSKCGRPRKDVKDTRRITHILPDMPREFVSQDVADVVNIPTKRVAWLLKQMPDVRAIRERNNNFRVKFQYMGESS